MTLNSLVVIFHASNLFILQHHRYHWPLQPYLPQQPLQPYFLKLPDPDGWIIPGTKMTKAGPFLWNRLKIHLLLISDTLSVGGC